MYGLKRKYKQLLDDNVARLSKLEQLLYASNRHALSIIFQAMDAAGKDGCIRHVMMRKQQEAEQGSMCRPANASV